MHLRASKPSAEFPLRDARAQGAEVRGMRGCARSQLRKNFSWVQRKLRGWNRRKLLNLQHTKVVAITDANFKKQTKDLPETDSQVR